MKLKIVLVDDEVLITDLLSTFLNNSKDIEVIGAYNSGLTFLKSIEQTIQMPDILLFDYRIGDIDGIELLQKVRAHNISIPVILLSSHYNEGLINFIVKSGFSAFLPKNIKPTNLIDVIKEVGDKGFYLTPVQFELLREQMTFKNFIISKNLQIALTDRELEILQLIAQQKTGKEIADKMFISLKTVESHKNSLFLKTGVKNVVGLIVYAVQNKLVNVDEIIIN
jgi:DNA-binding NarL/FixJ family response regulator